MHHFFCSTKTLGNHWSPLHSSLGDLWYLNSWKVFYLCGLIKDSNPISYHLTFCWITVVLRKWQNLIFPFPYFALWGIRHTNQTWGVSVRPLSVNLRAEWDLYNMNGSNIWIFVLQKIQWYLLFAVLYYASAAEISILPVHLVCSIYFTGKAWEICVWIVLNIYTSIELKYCLGWSVKAFKKCVLMEMFTSAKRNIPLFVLLTVSFVVVPNEKGSMLIRENTAMFHLPPLLQ